MTTINPTAGSAAAAAASNQKYGFSSLGAADFIKLLTAQLSQQDPTDPVDNKEMVAQMAQFSSLSSINEGNATLKSIAEKLDGVIAAQQSTAASLAALTANSATTTASA
jgi:flagellar basal-body rod modification protein FlgD